MSKSDFSLSSPPLHAARQIGSPSRFLPSRFLLVMLGALLWSVIAQFPSLAAGSSTPSNCSDARNFIMDMERTAAALKQYTFVCDMTVHKGHKVIYQQGNFYFKKPRQMRIEMTGEFKNGSVAVVDKNGKVRGHLGGPLSLVPMTLNPNSNLLHGANGYPFTDSDFASMTSVMQGFLKNGISATVSKKPETVEGQPRPVYVLSFFKPENNELYKKAWIDPSSMLPVVWFDYNDGKLFATTAWEDLKTDVELSDDLFQI